MNTSVRRKSPPEAQAKSETHGAGVNGNGHSSYQAPAVDKALDVLELLGEVTHAMSLTEIAEALGRTKQELFRVLVCLQERGYLVRDEAQSYRLSTKLFEVGSRHASTQTLQARALPHMRRLATRLGESCHLSIAVQNRMLVVARFESEADIQLAVRVGASFELHQRTTGLVALAYLSEPHRRDYWRQSGESASQIKACDTQLAGIRQRGFAELPSPVAVGVTDCAVPIPGSGESLLGVLCVSHIRRTKEPTGHAEIVAATLACARDISAEFAPAPSGTRTPRVLTRSR